MNHSHAPHATPFRCTNARCSDPAAGHFFEDEVTVTYRAQTATEGRARLRGFVMVAILVNWSIAGLTVLAFIATSGNVYVCVMPLVCVPAGLLYALKFLAYIPPTFTLKRDDDVRVRRVRCSQCLGEVQRINGT